MSKTSTSEPPSAPPRETDLYPPIKAFLEAQDYAVKGEVAGADVVAVRGDDPPVIVELKLRFSLALFHQAAERLRVTNAVYIAVARGGSGFAAALKRNLGLCRRLGLGLLTVRLADGFVEAHLDPGPYAPRPAAAKRARLLREFARRAGDPSQGGARPGAVMTAYRQDALRCLAVLAAEGPLKAAEAARRADVPRAGRILLDDHYGWFERVAKGVYALTPNGRAALDAYADALAALARADALKTAS